MDRFLGFVVFMFFVRVGGCMFWGDGFVIFEDGRYVLSEGTFLL